MKPLPRLGFVGVGWIGRHRMRALAESGEAEIGAIADTSREALESALSLAPRARLAPSFEALLALPLDGVVIATPSAMHAAQCLAALERGLHVFCQKPLGRTEPETLQVVETARRADRALGVDFSYRHTAALAALRDLVRSGELGSVFSLELVFHNAYGPDKPWFYDPALSGGGCVMDLGIHLVDTALWLLGFPDVTSVSSRLYAGGRPLGPSPSVVEDYATADLDLESGGQARLACSWHLPAGQEAVISVHAFGTEGGVCFRNVNGSFYDFVAERFAGTETARLVDPPDPWGGRALVEWVRKLRRRPAFDGESYDAVRVAAVLDRIYGRNPARAGCESIASNSALSSP